MAEIAPFRALRYNPDKVSASAVLAPPYDVIDDAGRAALADKDPHNCVRLILPDVGDAPGADERAALGLAGEGGDKYQVAAQLFATWQREGVLVRDPRPAVYRYHQQFQSDELGDQLVTRRGFIAAVRLHAFDEKIILPHERTLRGPKIDRLALMDATRAHLSQIFTMYSDPSGETDRVFSRVEHAAPDMDGTTDDGTRHLLWRVDDRELIGKLIRILAPLKLYIADGHHRYETMLALRERLRGDGALSAGSSAQYGTLFLANMNDPGLVVLPTHRMIHGLQGFSPEQLMSDAAAFFDITAVEGGAHNVERLRAALAESSVRRPTFAAVWPFEDDARLMALRADVTPAEVGLDGPPALTTLDVSLLHGLVLERLLGVDRAAQEAQTHIRYIKDTRKALEQTAAVEGQICFIMNSTRVDQVRAVADAGEVMPQKSTFFYPKIASGVLFTPIDPAADL